MSAAKSLFETSNFRFEILIDKEINVARVSSFYMMSGEFMFLAKMELTNPGFSQRGRINYSAGIFCLGNALELTYKMLLLKDGGIHPETHDFGKLYKRMKTTTKNDIDSVVVEQGWASSDEFHCFFMDTIKPIHRKYFDIHSVLNLWGNDLSCNNNDHKLWPQLISLCEKLHEYAGATIWINPNLPWDKLETLR